MNDLLQTLSPGSEADGQLGDAMENGLLRVDECRRDFLAGLPVQESEGIQLEPGSGKYLSRRICGRDCAALSYRLAPKMVVHTVPEQNWAVLVMPTNPRSDMVFNGLAARPFDLFLSAGRDGYVTKGKDRQNIAIGIRKTRLISACAALAGVGEEDIRLNDFVLLPREQVLRQYLHHALIGVAGQPGEGPVAEGRFRMPEAVENDLISVLAAQLAAAVRRSAEVNPLNVDALRVVRAAIAASEALPAPSLADLCAAAGVSQRWLHKCFMDVTGVSPYRYIRLARLSKARQALLASEDRPPLVKSLALSLGYLSSGRFAAEYRTVFQENPSDTLQRTCKA